MSYFEMTDDKRHYVVFSLLTEDRGHLLQDDLFWFRNLYSIDNKTRIYSSVTAVSLLSKEFPSNAHQFIAFKDYNWLKKINSRLHLAARIILSPSISNSKIVLQGFDEICSFLFFLKNSGRNNKIAVVPTNNISPERFQNSPKLLPALLRSIFKRSDKVFYHTDFELELIKKLYEEQIEIGKFAKVKYHLLGKKYSIDYTSQSNDWIISFFGPVMSSKPLEPLLNLISADTDQSYTYKLYRLTDEDIDKVKPLIHNKSNVEVSQNYLSYEQYLDAIRKSTFVLLPHNQLFEGKLSGILSDCIANFTPVISDNIEPVIEFFDSYGSMGAIYNYTAEPSWPHHFLKQDWSARINEFHTSIQKCIEDHDEHKIIREFCINF